MSFYLVACLRQYASFVVFAMHVKMKLMVVVGDFQGPAFGKLGSNPSGCPIVLFVESGFQNAGHSLGYVGAGEQRGEHGRLSVWICETDIAMLYRIENRHEIESEDGIGAEAKFAAG
ncbi:MAG: hypothetical protein ACF8AM_22965 [Rhodopirellula sp. JB055]|uniref:hypothetical protein n=1 Tax=Rhodopirellula sp. JB055 TaxID=3342846 RepID=UPI00370CC6C0